MAYGSRKSGRVSLEKGLPTHIIGIDGSWRVACTMSDITQTGARLTIMDVANTVPHEEFFLALSASGSVHRRCEVVRRDGDQLGGFITVPPLEKRAARR